MISGKCETFLLRQAGWDTDSLPPAKTLQQLAQSVKTLSDHYISSHVDPGRVYTDSALLQAYLLYYVPANIIKLTPVLDEVCRCPALRPLGTRDGFSMLDLGCGPGTFTLSALDYLCRCWRNSASSFPRTINLQGIDAAGDHVKAARQLVGSYSSGLLFADCTHTSVRFEQGPLLSASLARRFSKMRDCFDLIVAGNVFNEMPGEEAVSLCCCLETLLAPHGVLVFIEPGTRRSFLNLIGIRDAVMENTVLSLYAPCMSEHPCPSRASPHHWCHERLGWNPPAFIQAVDRYTGFAKQKGVTYTYCTFSKQPHNVSETVAAPEHGCLWRVVSYPIQQKGRELLYVCNGKERRLLRRLTRHASAGNADFGRAGRGDIVSVTGCRDHGDFYDIAPDSRFAVCSAADRMPLSRVNEFP